MRKLLVATHGRFASGIMETFKLIMGENEDISEISAYVEPGFDMQKEAEKKIHELNEYYGAAEPPVRCGESHLSGLTEPPHFIY